MAKNNHDERSVVKIGGRRENPFVQVDRELINNKELSWAARGLLCYLLSKPADWKIIIADLINQSPAGRDAVYSLINELIKHGYIVRETKREQGRFSGYEYIVYEIPIDVAPEIQKAPKRTAKPNKTKAFTVSGLTVSGLTVSGLTVSGKSDTTNKDLTNKDLTNKNITTTKKSYRIKRVSRPLEKSVVVVPDENIELVKQTLNQVTGVDVEPQFIQRLFDMPQCKGVDYLLDVVGALEEQAATKEVVLEAFMVDGVRKGYKPNRRIKAPKAGQVKPLNPADEKKRKLMQSMYS